MKKNQVLMLAGTIAVSGVVLLNGDVSVAADTTGVTKVKTAANSNYQNGTYTATATLYESRTDVSSMMSSMVNSQADVTIKNQTATITLTFGKLSNANMVKSWAIDGVEATRNGQTFTVAIPVVDLSKTLQSTIHIETVIGSVPFSETQPVDLTVKDLKLVARDPDEVAAEQAAAEKAAADKAAADKAAADKAAADKAAADKAAADKAAADKAAADKAAAEKAKQAAKAKAEQEATKNSQNGTYTATAKLYKSGTTDDSMMASMVSPTAYIVIKDGQATITLTFGKLSNANMVKSWAIDGVEATRNGQTFTVAIPVVDLSKTLQSTIHIETVIGSVPFSETQPVDLTVKDLKLVARDPDEVAAEQAAAEKAAADKAAADKAAADKAAADKAAADKAAAEKAAAEKAKQAAKAKAEQEATKNSQNGTYTATAKLYKSGTTDDSMMASMVSPTAYIVIKDGQATITLTFGKLSNANMVKSWVIDGVSAVKSGQSFVIVLPTSELGKTLKSTIHVETMLGTLPFTETQPVDLKLGDLKRIPSGSMPDNPSNPSNLPNNYVSPNQATGHDVPLTAQLSSSTSKLPNTATNETTTAPLLAALVSGVLALGIWLKKVLR